MRRISSKTTFLFKFIFPVFWFGFLTMFVVAALIGGPGDQRQSLVFLIMPIFMAVVGYVIMKKLIFDLVDEVWDDGAALIVRNRGLEDRVALSNVLNVSYSPFINPPRVTLMLRQPSSFGSEISFCAPVRFLPFTKSPVVEDLIRRVDAARRQ